MKSPHLKQAKELWKSHISTGDLAVDATCGNGSDTVYLGQLPLKHLIAMDLQETAIEETKKAIQLHLSKEEIQKVSLYQKSHETFEIESEVQLIVYNLGYLPKGDKKITTKVETTLRSLNAATHILAKKGAISITCYPGHEEGFKEKEAILHWASNLPSDQWEVCHYEWINRLKAPSLFWIVRI